MRNILKTQLKVALALFVIFSFAIQTASPCTIFSLYPNGQHWVGRTFDWNYGHGLIFTNKRNVTKKGLRLLPADVSGSWTSKYGSVTFNQFGREFPTGGMNEAGLMVDALELKTSVFQAPDTRASLNELQFMQYLLDNYASVESIQADVANIRMSPVGSKLHYFTCDLKNCMTIEFVNGQVVTHLKENMEISSLANNTYDEHVAYAREFVTFGGTRQINFESLESLDRFVRSSFYAKNINRIPAKEQIQTVFDILYDVGSKNNRWQLIYNQNEKTITFRTTAKMALQRKIDLKQFDFSCQSPVHYFDLDNDIAGAINASFLKFDPAINHAIIKKSVELQGLPAPLADRLAVYPNETVCN